MVTAKGGDGYWNLHPDDPTAIIDDLIPFRNRKRLGVVPSQRGMMGTSTGEYGALAIAERYPGLVSTVTAISPAVWPSHA